MPANEKMDPGLIGVSTKAFPVVIGTPFAVPARYFYIGTGGTVRVTQLDGTNVDYVNVPSGFYLMCCGTNIVGGGATTASNIVGHT